LWGALTLFALVVLACEAWFHRDGGRLAWTLRTLAAALIVGAWLDPMRAVAGAAPAPLALVDLSKSLLEETRTRAIGALGLSPGAPVLVFGGRPVATTLDRVANAAASAEVDATDIEAAHRSAARRAPEGGAIFCRGRETAEMRRGRSTRFSCGCGSSRSATSPATTWRSRDPADARALKRAREVLLRSDNPKVVLARITVRQGPKVLVRDKVRSSRTAFGRPVLLTAGLTSSRRSCTRRTRLQHGSKQRRRQGVSRLGEASGAADRHERRQAEHALSACLTLVAHRRR
jgi:hypothetical protein